MVSTQQCLKWANYGEGWWHDSTGRWHHQPTNGYYNVDPNTQQYLEIPSKDIDPSDIASIAQLQPAVRLTAAAKFMQGRRPKQEDRHILFPNLVKLCHERGIGTVGTPLDAKPASLYGLYDGHLGSLASEHCAKILHLNVVKEICTEDESSREAQRTEPSATAAADSSRPTTASNCTPDSAAPSEPPSDSTNCLEQDRPTVCQSIGVNPKTNAPGSATGGKRRHNGEEACAAANERGDDGPGVFRDIILRELPTADGDAAQHRRVSTSIFRAFLKTDKEFLEKYRVSRDGCTAVVSLFLGQWVYIASVGDSAAILAYKSDTGLLKVTKLTTDHKPNAPKERERIESNGAKVLKVGEVFRVAPADYEARCKRIKMNECSGGGATERPPVALAVSRAFGDREFKARSLLIAEPEITAIKLQKRHLFLFMACDGVWDVLNEMEVAEMIERHKGDAQAASSAVVTKAFQKGSQDNLTAVTIFFSDVIKCDDS